MMKQIPKNRFSHTARILLLLLSLSMMNACGGDGGTAGTDAVTDAPQTTEAVTEPSYLEQYDGVDFGGEDYTLAVLATESYPNYTGESNNGEPINDAQYARDSWIEEHYHVNLQYVVYSQDGKMVGDVQKQVQAGDTPYDCLQAGLN